jgi:hypothetical protein
LTFLILTDSILASLKRRLKAKREVYNASRFWFSDWASYWWLTCQGFCCIISNNDEDLAEGFES